MGTVIIATLQRGNSGTSPFPVSIPEDRKDAHIIVNSIAERDEIEEFRRIARMTCYVTDQDTSYRLGTDTTISGQTWAEEGTASNYQLKSERGQPEGYCPLNVEGWIDPIYVRSVYVQDSHVVADEAERNLLTASTGDLCHQLDTGQVFVKLNNDPAPLTNADWADITSASEVTSVNGQVGEVSITITNLLQWSNNASEFDDAVGGSTKVNSNTSQINVNSSDIQALYALLQDYISSPNTIIETYDNGKQYEAEDQAIYDPGVGRYNYYRCHTSPVGVGTAPDNTAYWERIGDFYTQQEIDDKLAEKADLVEGKVPLSQLPTNDLKGFYVVADLTERNNLDVNVDTRAIVLEATGDTRLPNGGLTEYLYKPADPRADTEGWVWTSDDTDQAFDFERPIKRIPEKGKVPGGDTVTEGLESMFFGPTEPDIRANDLDLAEAGSTSSAVITGEVSKEEADTIDQIDYVRVSDETILQSDIPASPGDSTQTLNYTCPAVDIIPGVTETYRVDVIYTTGGQQSKIAGSELPYEGVYPTLKGNTTDGLSDLYTLQKVLSKQENIYIGTVGGERIYFAIPELYDDLVDIQDQHSDSQFGSQFASSPTIVSVSSSGLTNNWTQDYKVYKSAYDVITQNERYGWLFNYEDENTQSQDSTVNQQKLDSIEWGAEVNQDDAEIKSQYEANNDTNAYVDAEKSKLSGIEAGAEVNQDDTEIKTQYENNTDTNAFTDAYKNKIDGIETTGHGDMLKSVYDTNDDGIVDGSERMTSKVLNLSGGLVTKGTLVYVDNWSVVQNVPTVILADRTIGTPANGMAQEDIADNAIGSIISQGTLTEYDTSSYSQVSPNDILYLDTAGTFTDVRPTEGIIQGVGIVTYSDVTDGVIYVALSGVFGSSLEDWRANTPYSEKSIVAAQDPYQPALNPSLLRAKKNLISHATFDPDRPGFDDDWEYISGDMSRSVYDTDNDGIVDKANATIIGVYNDTGGAITKGKLVYFTDFDLTSLKPTIALADKDNGDRARGIVLEDINDASEGEIITTGTLIDISTLGLTVNDTLYLDTAGDFTEVEPTTGIVQKIGYVTRVDNTLGRVYFEADNSEISNNISKIKAAYSVGGGTYNKISFGTNLIIELTQSTSYTLPEISTVTFKDYRLEIKNDSGSNAVINCTGSDTIEGDPTITLLDSENLSLYMNSTEYKIL